MSEARINSISNENNTGGPTISGITTFSGLNFFVPPKGTTAQRPSDCPPGSVRFNTDSAHLEYFDGLQWLEFEAFNTELNGGARGFVAGGAYPTNVNLIDYFTISVLGNSQDFGDLTTSRSLNQGCSSITRGIIFGGNSNINVIDFVTISSTGDAQDFGDMQSLSGFSASLSNQTRGICNGSGATLDYITISSTGNAIDFGFTTNIIDNQFSGGISSPVRGIFSGGATINTINYITISTTGNGQDFGDLITACHAHSGCSNATRGVYGGSSEAPTQIIFVTIATTGNAQDFGDLSVGGRNIGASASPTRGVFAGRGLSSSNTIEYITISTTGNSLDFGDILSARGGAGFSNGHGGL